MIGCEELEIINTLIIASIIGLIPAFIAKNKGHSFGWWWFFGAMLWIVALPWAIFGLKSLYICPKCKETVKENAKICKHCGSKIEQKED